MNVTDYIKLSKIIYKNNKFRTFISIGIVAILSLVYMFILFIGFSYYNNSNIIEEKYLQTNPISLSLIMKKNTDFDFIIKNARKTNPSISISETANISLVDFSTLDYDDLKLISGRIPELDKCEIIVGENYSHVLDDIILINEIECLVVGIYQSEYFDGPIGDVITFSKMINLSSITFIYDCATAKANLLKISNFSEKIQNLGHEEFTSKTLEQVKQYRIYSYLILIVCILTVILFFACTIGFYLNSISMCFDQGKRIFTLLNIVGGSNKDSTFILFVYTFIISIIGVTVSGILMLIFTKLIDVNDLFISVIPSVMIDVISNDFEYDNSFPWSIPILISLLFVVTIFLNCYRLIIKDKQLDYMI